ncbi:MAG: LuxR family transcriptional regulator [uncultured bacterium]|nr:MAG: LuxR family transcriptional regulator [uncultured bacterium]
MRKKLEDHLAQSDLLKLLLLSYKSLSCDDHNSLKSLILSLKELFYFDNSVCAKGNVLDIIQNKDPEIEIFDICYPEGYMDFYMEKKFFSTDGALFEFFTNLSPVHWLSVEKGNTPNYPVSVHANDFNMHDGWTHGTLDPKTMDSVVFYFGRDKSMFDERVKIILEYIIPFFSEAYKRISTTPNHSSLKLTDKEIEVLNWIKEGKSSWGISVIQGVSQRTVDFHVTNIKRKLGVFSRPQAVAVGLQLGIIKF